MSKKKAEPVIPGHEDDSNCRGCMFHNTDGRGTCNFCYITGKRRGCPVVGCTRKMIGPELRLSRDIMLEGSDPARKGPPPVKKKKESVVETQTGKTTTYKRPEHPWEQPPAAHCRMDRAKAWEMWQNGMNDAEIAAACGVSKLAVSKWRWAYGIPPTKSKEAEAWR